MAVIELEIWEWMLFEYIDRSGGSGGQASVLDSHEGMRLSTVCIPDWTVARVGTNTPDRGLLDRGDL